MSDITEFTARDFINYDVIFEGKLDTIYDRGKYMILPFTVTKNYKSADTKIVDVVLYGTTCDPRFEIGKSYRVFGSKDGGPLYNVSKCGRTHELTEKASSTEMEDNKNNDIDSVVIAYNGQILEQTVQEVEELLKNLRVQIDSLVNYLSTVDSGHVVSHYLNGQVSV